MQVQFWAATDVGLTRDHNEDNYLVDPNISLFVVADGMGGHAAGEIASSVAVHEVREAIKKQKEVIEGYKRSGSVLQRQTVLTLLEQSILAACKSVYQCAQEDSERHGMGTTLSLLLLVRNRAFVGHVGDSRIYRTRKGVVSQITEDHTVINELIKSGRLKPDEAFNSPYKNAVTRAVGVHPSVEVDTFDFEVQVGDNYLLCSDGLSGYLEDQHTLDFLSHNDVKKIPKNLIDFANDAGGKDNITAIVIRVEEVESQFSTGFLPPIPSTSIGMVNELDEIDDLEAEDSLISGTDQDLAVVEDPQLYPSLSHDSGPDGAPPPLPPSKNNAHQLVARPAINELGELPINLLKVSPLFGLLDQKALESFVSVAELISLEANAALKIKGDEDDSLYFLYRGELRIEDEEQVIGTLMVGATIGEEHLLEAFPTRYNIVANEDAELLCWRKEALHIVMANSPEISARIMWGLALYNQRKVKRMERSLHMLNELFEHALQESEGGASQHSLQAQAQQLLKSCPASNEVHTPLSQLPHFVKHLPLVPKPTFDLSIEDAKALLKAEVKESSVNSAE